MNSQSSKGGCRLLIAASIIAAVWLLALPWLGARRSVRAQIDSFYRQGIDPAAMYYTDLEAMERLESEVAAAVQAHPDAFW